MRLRRCFRRPLRPSPLSLPPPWSQLPSPSAPPSSHLPFAVWLLRCYPRAWRERFGDELGELLCSEPTSWRVVAWVLAGALDAHLHPHLVPAPLCTASDRLRAALLTVFCAFIAFLVAALGLFEAVQDLALSPLMRSDPQLTRPWAALVAGAIMAVPAALVGGVPLLVTVLKEAYATRRQDLRLFAVPPVAVLVLCGCDGVEEVRRAHRILLPPGLGVALDLVFHALFVVAAASCAFAVCAVVVRSRAARTQLFRFALAPAVVVTGAMAVMLGATGVWLAQAHADAPARLAHSPLVAGCAVVLAVMALSTLVAIRAVARGLTTHAGIGPPAPACTSSTS